MDLDEAAAELYAVPPDEFVELRTRLAKECGNPALAKQIKALRKPTISAWAVNLLARDEVAGSLLELGEELRAAWAEGAEFSDLERRRTKLVEEAVRKAVNLAGRPLAEQARREVEDTLQAAVVDADIAEEFREGRLAQPRSHVGFGFGFPGTSVPKPKPKAKAKESEPAEDPRFLARRLEAEAIEAEKRAAEAEAVRAERQRELDGLRLEIGEYAEEEERLKQRLEELKGLHKAASSKSKDAERELSRATRVADAARNEAEDAKRKAKDATPP